MKGMFSRITALVLAAVMILSLSAVISFADGTVQAVTLAEMNQLSFDGLKSNPKTSLSTVAYKDAKGSVMYPLGERTSLYWQLDKKLNELPAGVLKVRFYSEDIGAQCALVFRCSEDGKEYGWKRITVNYSGWQEITVASTEAMFNNAVKGSADQIVFNGYGFNLGTKFLGKSIYLDSVWYEPTDTDYSQSVIADSEAVELIKTPAERSGNSFNKNKEYAANYTCTTDTRDGGDGVFTMLYIPDSKQYNFNLLGGVNSTNVGSMANAIDNGYNYLNLWVYSPAPQTGGFGLIPITDGSFNNNTDTRAVRTVDWTGWRLVSFDISDLVDVKSINLNFNGFVNNTMGSGFIYSCDKETGAASALSGTENCHVGPWQRWTQGGYIGFENIWLSKVKPEYNEQAASGNITPIEKLETDTVLVDADKAPLSGATETTVNSRVYGKAYRSGNVLSRYISGKRIVSGGQTNMYFARTPAEYNSSNYETTYTQGIKSNNYLNMWMYLPNPQYDQFGNYSEYQLVITRMRNNGPNTKAIGIVANWSGWKLISVKLSSGGVGVNDYLGDIYISTNAYRKSAWNASGEIDTSAILYDNYTYDLANPSGTDVDKIDLDASVDYRGNFYNTFYDVANTAHYDIERVWLSSEKPAAAFEGSIAPDESQATVNRDITAREFSFVSDTDIAYVGGEAVNTDAVATVRDSENKRIISGSFASDLELSKTYTIALPTLTDAAGNKYNGQTIWQVTTQGLHIYNENDTIMIKMSDAVHMDNLTAKLICAFYSEGKVELEDVVIADYDESIKGYQIDYSTYKDFPTGRYMLWNEKMEPLMLCHELY